MLEAFVFVGQFLFCVNVNLTLYFVQLFIAKSEKELVDRKKFFVRLQNNETKCDIC